jgi:hypothetical protein
MVNKNFHQLKQETKLLDENPITYKEAEPCNIQDIEQIKANKKIIQSDFIPDKKEKESNFELKEEPKNEIKVEKEKEEQKNEIKEEPKNEIKVEKGVKKEETKNEIKIEVKEETKDKAKKKKNRHKKNKKEKKGKIFEIPKTNPYRDLFDFKEVSKLRFQDNSIFRVINNWEEKEWSQTTPPTKDIDELFPNQIFPQGEIQPYLK